jgi:hypothetical protein
VARTNLTRTSWRALTVAVLAGALVAVICTVPLHPAAAQDVTLRDAIKCEEFKRNADGTWYAESVSLNHGPGKRIQTNLFDTTITQKSHPEIFAILNEKCAPAR